MRRVTLILTLPFLSVATLGQISIGPDSFPNLKEIIRKNKIRKELVYDYKPGTNGRIKDSSLIETIKYDLEGSIIEQERKINYFITPAKMIYTFNDLKQVSKIVTYDLHQKQILNVIEFFYDSLGNQLSQYEYDKDTARLTIEKRIIDTSKKVTAIWIKINNNDYYFTQQIFYQPGGAISRIDSYDTEGTKMYPYLFEYDTVLNTKTVYLQNKEGKNIESIYWFNKEKFLLQSMHKNPDRQDEINVCEKHFYDSNHLLIVTEKYIGDKKIKLTRHFF